MKKKAFTLCCSLLFSLLSVWIILKKRIFAFFRAVVSFRFIVTLLLLLFHSIFFRHYSHHRYSPELMTCCARKIVDSCLKHIFNEKPSPPVDCTNGRRRLPKVGTRGTNMQKTAASKHCATSWQHTRGKLPLSCIWLVSVISFILLHSFVCLLAFLFFLFDAECDFSAFFLFFCSFLFCLLACLWVCPIFFRASSEIWRLEKVWN